MTPAMSDLAELMADCDARGIRLHPAGEGDLTIDAPQETLKPDMVARLKAHKAELLALLRPAPAAEPQPMPTMNPTAMPVWWRGMAGRADSRRAIGPAGLREL